MFDPFVEFEVGGTFRKDVLPAKGGKKRVIMTGERGQCFKTEIIANL